MIKKLILLLTVSVLFACSGSDSEVSDKHNSDVKKENKKQVKDNRYGGMIVEASIGDASGLIYNITADSTSHDVAGNIFNGLVKYDKNLNITGDLAEKWDISDDNKVITFHLRKNVKWHDGEPFTAKDVEFTYKFMIDEKTPTVYDGDFRRVSDFKVIDDYTVQVTYDEPYAPALISWGMAVLPSHLLQGVDITKSELIRHPIGTGPYKFKEWKTGEHILIEANPDYFDGEPFLKQKLYRVIPDTATIFLELLNGSVDMMGLTPLQWTKQTDNNPRFSENYTKYSYAGNAYTYIGYNMNNPLFADKRVRQALTFATPKQQIVDGILFGLGKPATGPYKPDTIWYNPNVKKYPYSITKAKELLAEAGWKDTNGDGILDKNGKKFEFTIITNQGNDIRSKIAQIVQQSWQEVGIKVNIQIFEWATFINEYINKRKFEAVILGWNITHDPDLFDVWHSLNTEGNKLNFVGFKNAEADELMMKGLREFDPEKRKVYYHRIQEIFAEEQPYTFLYAPDSLISVHKRFRGIEPAPAGISHNMEKWFVPADERKHTIQP